MNGASHEESLDSSSSSTFANSATDLSSLSSSINGALLGSSELMKCLPNSEANIQITTWNMGSLPLPSDHKLKAIFYNDEVHIHVVAIQESWPDTDASELLFQICLGHDYGLFHSTTFGTLHLCIFIKRNLLWYTTEPLEVTNTVRSGRLFKTKGSIGIGFGLFGTKFLFINAHLSAGEETSREVQRMEELNKILLAHEIKKNQYDIVYLFGDLNFRISTLQREVIIEELKRNNLQKVIKEDQLGTLFNKKSLDLPSTLRGFEEAAAITFRPTYKYDIGTDNFDSSAKKRAPAYTDRILCKCIAQKNGFPISSCLKYDAVTEVKVSDHRPVIGLFAVKIKAGFDTLPITGGRFKRELYVKAMQKRAKFLLDHRKKLASQVCYLS